MRICPAQSLPVSRTGTGCFFFLKKVLPAGGKGVVEWWEKAAQPKGKGTSAGCLTSFLFFLLVSFLKEALLHAARVASGVRVGRYPVCV